MLFCFNPLYSLIVSSSFCLPAAKSGIGVFGENNVGKNRRDDPENTDANVDRGTGANDLGTRTNADVETDNLVIIVNNLCPAADNPSIATNNPGRAEDHPGTAADNRKIATDNPNTAAKDPSIAVNNLSRAADNSGIKTDADTRVNNPNTATSIKPVPRFFLLYVMLFFY